MNKALRVFIFSIIFIVVGYTTYFIFDWVKYGYQIEIKNYKPYFWIFKENVKKDVDTTFHVAFIRKTDILNAYRYKDQYEIFIWDFKDLKTINLKNIAINLNPIKF